MGQRGGGGGSSGGGGGGGGGGIRRDVPGTIIDIMPIARMIVFIGDGDGGGGSGGGGGAHLRFLTLQQR